MTVALKQSLQGMEDFRADTQGVMEGFRADGHDHEFLNIQVVGGMSAAVDDVHHGGGHDFCVDSAEILIQGQAQKFGRGAGCGEGDAQHGVGAEAGLVVRAVEVEQGGVHLHLAQGVKADNGFGNFSVHMFHGLGDALSFIAGRVAIAQLKRFPCAGGGSGGHGGAAHMAGFQTHFHFHSGVAAGIQNFAGPYRSNRAAVHIFSFSLRVGSPQVKETLIKRFLRSCGARPPASREQGKFTFPVK